GVETASLREPARQAFAEGAQRALLLNASVVSYELAIEAIDLTEPDDPRLPELQLLAGRAARDLADVDATPLLEDAGEGFLALGDVPRAAEASMGIAREALHRGDTGRSLEAGRRALELARSVPLTAASALALSGRARQVEILEGDHEEAIALAQEVLTF